MYERESKSGHTVVWEPSDDQAAVQAMQDTPGIPDNVSLPDEANVPLEAGTAEEVRQRYAELVPRDTTS